ncbi:hypothetical protein P7K49_013093, partial [Saguinus oedipus]
SLSEMTHSLSTERLVFVSGSLEELHRLLGLTKGYQNHRTSSKHLGGGTDIARRVAEPEEVLAEKRDDATTATCNEQNMGTGQSTSHSWLPNIH